MVREVNYCKDNKYSSRSLEMICFTRGYLIIFLYIKTDKTCFDLIFTNQECQQIF